MDEPESPGKGHRADAVLDPALAELIVRRLIEWREARGLSQEAAAHYVGMSKDWLAGIEKSINRSEKRPNPLARVPGLIAAKRLCRCYRRRLADLVASPSDVDQDSESSSV